MRVLVFDTETTGLPESRMVNPDTLHLWPHIVQFSYIIYDTCLNEIITISDSIIKVKKDIIISDESIKFHGITNKISDRKGVELDSILEVFFEELQNVDVLVGHNISFDINMLKIELLRLICSSNIELQYNERKMYRYYLHCLTNHNVVCTIKESVDVCCLKAVDKFGKEYFKYPKLTELHQVLFNSEPNNLHNSLYDIMITLRCFMKLKFDTDLNKTCRKFKKLAKEMRLL